MVGSASVLGILPPATVRIDLDGWVHDYPWDWVDVHDDRVNIVCGVPRWLRWWERLSVVVFYPYEHAHQQDDGSWLFIGAEDFTVTAGPPQPPSVN